MFPQPQPQPHHALVRFQMFSAPPPRAASSTRLSPAQSAGHRCHPAGTARRVRGAPALPSAHRSLRPFFSQSLLRETAMHAYADDRRFGGFCEHSAGNFSRPGLMEVKLPAMGGAVKSPKPNVSEEEHCLGTCRDDYKEPICFRVAGANRHFPQNRPPPILVKT